ncbi:MAG TPA: SDR family NAD(P)-dependent oxidoreductase [Stellaceae bacterium]|nr:SDR family NAD(P)-dependent oxidoreductase [Stellaceae bacterium]
MSGPLAGRVALVTGGGRGIGRAIVEALHGAGAAVVIADHGTGIDGTGADPLVARDLAARLGARAAAYPQSIASPGSAAAAVALATERFGALDILVNNAAILRDFFLFKADPLAWDAVIRTNLSAPFYMLAAASPLLRDQARAGRGGGTWGRVINIVSTAGLYGNFGQAAYASAKAGLLGLTRVAALDLQRSGVACNALAPFAATRVTDTVKPANPAQAAYKERALKVPAAAVAELAAWLAGDEAQGVSGQLFGVRGRELFLFSQPRPKARLERQAGEALGAMIARDLAPHYVELGTDLEAFSGEPLV